MERENRIEMQSLTQAMKMKDILSKHGIRSQLVRTPGGASNGGCGYSLYVPEQFRRAQTLINSGGAGS